MVVSISSARLEQLVNEACMEYNKQHPHKEFSALAFCSMLRLEQLVQDTLYNDSIELSFSGGMKITYTFSALEISLLSYSAEEQIKVTVENLHNKFVRDIEGSKKYNKILPFRREKHG